jgi:histidyl-tRNA synthetase
MESQRCKGMKDLLPDDMCRFRHIEDTFRNCCVKWGYREVRTPSLEYLHLFTATGTLTPSRLGRAYSFLDWNGWSGERVVLRPDGTIPIARLYIENLSQQQNARLFYVTDIFAFEQTGKENRERWQCGVEFLGGAGPMADVELILLARELLHNLGIDEVELRLSHAGLAKALVKELGLSPRDEAEMLGRILDGDWQAWRKAKTNNLELDRFLTSVVNFKGKLGDFLKKVKLPASQASAELKSSLRDFTDIVRLLDDLKCGYWIDIAAIHGFEYYTGVCLQLFYRGEKIGGGGRYDELLSLMGSKNMPACGFAIYVEPVIKMLSLKEDERSGSGVLVKAGERTPGVMEACFSLAQSLRNTGHIVELDLAGGRTSDYRWVVSVPGEGSFVIIDRKTGEKREVSSLTQVAGMLGGVD